jgi:predicted dehydrogenase
MRLGVAIVGAGFIGGVHARAARLTGADLVAVMDSSPESSAAAADRFGALRALDSLEDLAGADDIDVVHVCTPNWLHAEQVRAVLAAGKHVICEKPLATTAEEASELAALARSSDLVATIPFVYRFYPNVRQARAMVGNGSVGDLRLLHGSYLQDWMSKENDWSWRVDPQFGGLSRVVADIGSHWFDLVEFVSGHRVTRLNARLHTAIRERWSSAHSKAFSVSNDAEPRERHEVTTEDAGLLMFETDGGAIGSTVVSQISPGRKNRLWFELDGAETAIVFDQELPEQLWLGSRDGVRLFGRGEPDMASDAARFSLLPAGHPQGYQDAFNLFISETYERIRGEVSEGLPTFEDGARSSMIVAAALESAATGQWIDVPQIPA